MPLLTLNNIDFSVGGPLLLEKVCLSIESNERIALIGRNGAGKSTLMKIIAGEVHADDGDMKVQAGVRITRLEQEVPHGTHGTVYAVIAAALGEAGKLLDQYHQLTHSGDEIDLDELAKLQHAIDDAQAWGMDSQVEETITRLSLPEDAEFDSLSGGMKRRVLLGRALVSKPDILLLDEPTNHLDLTAIAWLESVVLSFAGSIVFVTHDRRFLKRLATRIIEIDRGQVSSWPGDYENYLRRREERLHAEAMENERFDKKLAQEEVWIRQGIKARRTRNEGRVRVLKDLRNQRSARRDLQGNMQAQVQNAAGSGRKVIDLKSISYGWERKQVVTNFSTTIMRGDRVGLIGSNGSGKTTLLSLMLGKLEPQSGEVALGTQLEIAYFDQHRNILNDAQNAVDNVAEGREFIEVNGQRKHIIGYLQDFLFSPDRARAPITKLSGGERNRLLLAKLFSKPSNLLVMDEPTNDLDMETLELLEELLLDYQGTLLLVSHDREFLDNVVTQVLVFEGDGEVNDYVGGYSDWLAVAEAKRSASEVTAVQTVPSAPAASVAAASKTRKLSYKEQRELDELPKQIEQLDAEIATMTAQQADPVFYQRGKDEVLTAQQKLADKQSELEAVYARWEAIEKGLA